MEESNQYNRGENKEADQNKDTAVIQPIWDLVYEKIKR